ncbi:MAG: amidoligase family protein [Armatimonadota bacterium]
MIDFRSLRFGVEVECTGQTRERVGQAIQSVVGGEAAHTDSHATLDPWEVADRRGRKWRVVSDASLTDVQAHLRAEVVTPILSYEDIPELQRTTGELHPIETIRGNSSKSRIDFILCTGNGLRRFYVAITRFLAGCSFTTSVGV